MKLYLIFILLLFLFWIYILTVFKREKLTAFYFIWGTAGSFSFTFFFFKDFLANLLSDMLINTMKYISKIIPTYQVYSEYNTIFIDHNDAAISLFIDYECCGMIEAIIIICIILFFDAIDKKYKILFSFIGFIYTFLANIIRLLIVIQIIYLKGNQAYYISHSIIGRIVFYILNLFLYFYMITYPQIKKQKIGRFDYK